ncbi:MAG: hypothetical protein EOO89_00045 [Pedobacter sp.]|nr:MAG: hypothetical protein EOO89_00045 [Pedobacter sp.]
MTLVERILFEAYWPDEFIADDVRKLLDKTDEREENYELFGYPANSLGTPAQVRRMQQESVHALLDGADYFLFEMMRFSKDDISVGSAFSKANGIYRFRIKNRYVYLQAGKLRQLLLDHKERKQVVKGDRLLIRLPKQVLLDHADKLD